MPAWRADHYVTGLARSPMADMRVTAEAYRKNYTSYPVASDLPTVSLANIGDTFDVREILFPLTTAGEGHAEGVEIFVEKRLMSKLYGRVDIRVDSTFSVGAQRLNMFLGVQNVINRRNFASYSWNRRTNTQQLGEQQGIFPILGFDWRF